MTTRFQRFATRFLIALLDRWPPADLARTPNQITSPERYDRAVPPSPAGQGPCRPSLQSWAERKPVRASPQEQYGTRPVVAGILHNTPQSARWSCRGH